MQKGFGFYSPHEATIFFLKTLLLSFWLGVDLISALIASTLPADKVAQHGWLSTIALAILATGTVFSALFVWATGSLSGGGQPSARRGILSNHLQLLKQRRRRLIGAGAIGVASILAIVAICRGLPDAGTDTTKRLGRASLAISKKCTEIAELENKLFQSDEQTVMAECLLQYDEKYASLRNSTTPARQ